MTFTFTFTLTMMATKNPSNVPTRMGVLIVLVALALMTTRSDAFVSPQSIVNANANANANRVLARVRNLVPSPQQHNDDRSSRLYSSTASGSGFAVIDSWKLLPDGRIQGVMADTGDNVLTSPLRKKKGLRESTTIRTISGSRYGIPSIYDTTTTTKSTVTAASQHYATGCRKKAGMFVFNCF